MTCRARDDARARPLGSGRDVDAHGTSGAHRHRVGFLRSCGRVPVAPPSLHLPALEIVFRPPCLVATLASILLSAHDPLLLGFPVYRAGVRIPPKK